MRDRLITVGGALLALTIVYVMFFQKTPQAPITRPLSTETGRNGYSALASWLAHSGVPVASFRQRFDRLSVGEDEGEARHRHDGQAPDQGDGMVNAFADAVPFAATGNILITTMPHLIPVRDREQQSLRAWIRSGNTLLVLAALDDTPEWSLQGATIDFLAQVESITGLRFVSQRRVEPTAENEAKRTVVPPESPVEFEPAVAHPLMQGVETLRGFSDYTSDLWQAPVSKQFDDQLLLRLAVERSTGIDAAWQHMHGDGQVIVAASGSLLTNRMVAEADAGRLLANIVRYHLADGGTVIFDDMHQGLSVIYDAAAFYGDPRLQHTVLFLIAGWLIYLLGSSNRIAPPRPPRDAPRQGDFIAAVGGFMARRLDRRDAGLLMFEEWFDEVRRTRGLVRGKEPPWEHLLATPTLGRATCAKLRESYEDLKSGRPVGLVRLHNTLRRARKAIG